MKRVLLFIGGVFLVWVIGTLIHVWRLMKKGVIIYDHRSYR